MLDTSGRLWGFDQLTGRVRTQTVVGEIGFGSWALGADWGPVSDKDAADTLNAALGLELSFRFRVDPALIAGVELRSPNTIVRNSWRADLDRIRKELDGDGHPNES